MVLLATLRFVSASLFLPHNTGNYKLKLKDRKGSDILEWFDDLRLQQFPN
jgi:hypothetical protein